MSKIIVWQVPDGRLSITRPVEPRLPGETENEYLDRIAAKAQQPGYVRKSNVEEASLPQSYEFYGQWRMVGNAVIEDATEVIKEILRRVTVERDKRLRESDADFLELIESGADQTAMKNYRTSLRDVVNQPDPANINWPVKP